MPVANDLFLHVSQKHVQLSWCFLLYLSKAGLPNNRRTDKATQSLYYQINS